MGYNTPKQTVSQFQLKGRYARQYLSFAGKPSKDFLLYLSGPGVYDSPAADVESTSVPGKNGDIITENARTGRRRYQNVDIKYKAFFFNGLPAKTAAVKAWLLSPIGYQKLQDTYDPDFFRMAVCKDALEFDVTAQKAAEMEQTFNCKPQRWSVDGQRVIRLDGRSTLKNPFAFPAQPIFKVYGDSGGELYVGEVIGVIEILNLAPVNMGIPFKGATKGVKNTNKTGNEIFGFVQGEKEFFYNIRNRLKKTVQQAAVFHFQKEVPQGFINGKDKMPMGTVNQLKGHSSSPVIRIFSPACRAKFGMAAKRDKLKISAMGTAIHGTTIRGIAAVDDLFHVFHDNRSGF